MAKKKSKKIVRYRKPLNINVGMIIFALIFAYMTFYVYTYIKRDKIQFYEVTEGSIVNDQSHTGIIFREEEVKYTTHAGNINNYLSEGKRAAVGTRIYSIDETGAISKLLAERSDEQVVLSAENLSTLKKQLSSFSQDFDDVNFDLVYDIKSRLDSEALEFANVDALRNMDSVIKDLGVNFEQVRSDKAGVVSYSIDSMSMEALKPAQVTMELFDKTAYTRHTAKSGQLVEEGTPAYRLVTSSEWSVVFPLSEEASALYNGQTSLPVKFPSRGLETPGAYSVITGADGKTYGKLDFNKYMEQFISDRFIDFEIVTEAVSGLKIPRSAVTTENFFLIPKDYYTKAADGSGRGFYKETYGEDGATSIVLVTPAICNADEQYYYVDASGKSELKAGDYLVMENSQNRYQVGPIAPLEGVYNINRGYAVFKRIEVLTSNDEYFTVRKGSDYGLSVYDHIVLDAAAMTTALRDDKKPIFQ